MDGCDLRHVNRVRLLVEPNIGEIQLAFQFDGKTIENASHFGGLSLTSSMLTVSVVVAVSGIGNPASTALITTE